MKMHQNEKLWIAGGVAVGLVLAAGAWFGAISPELSHVSSLHTQQADADSQNQLLIHRTNKLRADSEQLPTIVKQLQADLTGLPVTADLAGYTTQLNRQAGVSGVTISAINIGDPALINPDGSTSQATSTVAAGHIFGFPVTLSTTGGYAAQLALLKQIQRTGPRVALVHSVKFVTAGGARAVDTDSTMTVQLTIFVTPLSPAAAAQLQTELGGAPAS
ncbi:MAG TPA: hypothetical protein VFU36_10135 [Jatrophihabitans sp.]|nr:hypothetical protein [Jatrophihabitans sp.]